MIRKSLFLYAVYGIITFFSLAWLLFPRERAGKLVSERLHCFFPGYEFKIEAMHPVFPLGVGTRNSKIVFPNGSTFVLESVSLFPDFLSLFKDEKAVVFKAKAYRGDVDGNVAGFVTDSLGLGKLQLHYKGIEIDDVRLTNLYGAIRLQLVMDGDFEFRDAGRGEQTVRGKISAIGCKAVVESPLFDHLGISEFNFERIDVDYRMKNFHLNLLNFKAFGKDVDLTATGSIVLEHPFEKSRLNLKGALQIHPSSFNEFSRHFSVARIFENSKNRGIPFKISGTVKVPKISP